MNHKGFLCRVLCFFAVLALTLPLTGSAFAATVVAQINGTNYTSVTKAWDYAMDHSGSVIEMMADWRLGERLDVEDGVKVTIHMHGYMINRAAVDRSNPTYASDSRGSGSIFFVDDDASLTIFGRDTGDAPRSYRGSLIGSSKVWVYDGKGDVALEGGVITGGSTDSGYGGAFTVEEGARLEIRDVSLCGNVADRYGVMNGRGGAILVEDDDSSVILDNCLLAYNYAEWEGGAICVDDGENVKLTVKNSTIRDNVCESYGGAVCITSGCDSTSLSLRGTTVSGNRAKVGGGLYLYEEGVSVVGGTVRDNTASMYGGGIYIGDNIISLQDITVTGNRAREDAGVLVGSSITGQGANVVNLAGKIIIRENTTTSGKASNLHLDGTYGALTNRGLLTGTPSDQSEIWISTDEDGAISVERGRFNDAIYHAEASGKSVYWNQDASDEYYRYLMIGNESGGTPSQVTLPEMKLTPTDISLGTGLLPQVTAFTYNDCPVYRGFGGTDSTDLVGPYYYSDGYFMDDPTQYNEHLATLSLRLAMAAMNSSVWKDSDRQQRGYTLQPNHIKQMLADIGVEEKSIFLSETYFEKPGTDTIGYALGAKELCDKNGDPTGDYLIPVAVRGAGYEAEWTSNVTLGDISYGEHRGFREAADQVLAGLEAFIDDQGLRTAADTGHLRFWVVGFSRAGATANLTAKTLVETYGTNGNKIFGYPFEAPQGGMAGTMVFPASTYDCIHNVLLAADVVPHVAMTTMRFQRYGVDHYLPGTDAGTPVTFLRRYSGALYDGTEVPSNYPGDPSIPFRKDNDYYDTETAAYQEQRAKMLYQLAGSDHSIVFDDYFHLATFSIYNTITFQSDHIEEFGNDSVTAAQWVPDFIYYLNEWLTGTTMSRAKYVANYEQIVRKLMEASNIGTLDIDKAMDRLLSFSVIWKILSISHEAVYISSLSEKAQRIAQVLEDAGVIGEDSIPLTKEQVWPTIGMALNVILDDMTDVGDYRLGTSVDYGDDDEYLVMLATLVYNADAILQNHNHQVVYAWLRSYDSYYLQNENNTTSYWYTVRAAEKSAVDKPYLSVTLNGGTPVTLQDGDTLNVTASDSVDSVVLHMTARNAGGEVFYSVDQTAVPASLYYAGERSIAAQVNAELTAQDTAVITAENVWYTTPSGTATFVINRDPTLHTVYVDGTVYGQFNEGDSVSVTAPEKECYTFNHWDYREENAPKLTSLKASAPKTVGALAPVDPEITFSMPAGDVYLTSNYDQLQATAPFADLPELDPGEAYSTDRELNLYSVDGDVDDGFHIVYTASCEDDSGMSGMESGMDSPILLYSLMGSGIADYYPTRWTVTARVTREGWLDSEEVTFHYIIDYTKQSFVVLLDGATVSGGDSDGAASAVFHPGDTVSVKADTRPGFTFSQWTVQPDTLTLSAPKAAATSFVMPFEDVSLTAAFTKNPPPKTGDSSSPVVWLALGSAALIAVVLMTRKRRKK